MTSRERVLATLEGRLPDRIPWMEMFIDNNVGSALFGHDNFFKANYSQKQDYPGMVRLPPAIRDVIPLDNICYDLAPPRFAETKKVDNQDQVVEGLIKVHDDIKFLDKLPDPDQEEIYRTAEDFLNKYKKDSAALLVVRTGVSNTYLSMGIENFCMSTITQPDLVKEIMWRFNEWSVKVIKNAQELPFDVFFVPDDIAFGTNPMISQSAFQEFCAPVMKNAFDVMKLPIIYHSDGNILPLLGDIIDLGVDAIANFEPSAIDIEEIKRSYGDKITLMGNIDLHYTLTQGTPEETANEVERRIKIIGDGGRYILSSSNSLPNYVKIENVRAMAKALLDFGFYV